MLERGVSHLPSSWFNFNLTNVFVCLNLQFLRGILLKQPCESLLASPKRQLLYEGPLILLGKSLQTCWVGL